MPRKPSGMHWYNWLVTRLLRHGVVRPIARMKFFTVRVTGKENLPKAGGNIVAGNHPSVWDPLVVAAALDRNVVFLAKAELWKNTFLRPFLNLMGQIPVVRGNRNSGASAQSGALAVLNFGEDKGGTVAIFPEGSTTPKDETGKLGPLKPFKVGVYHLAYESGVPVIPVAICGAGDIPKARLWHIIRRNKPVSVQVRFGEQLYASHYAGPQEFLDELFWRIQTMLDEM